MYLSCYETTTPQRDTISALCLIMLHLLIPCDKRQPSLLYNVGLAIVWQETLATKAIPAIVPLVESEHDSFPFFVWQFLIVSKDAREPQGMRRGVSDPTL